MRNRDARVGLAVVALWVLAAAGAHAQPGAAAPFALSSRELLDQAAALPARDKFAAVFQLDESRFELDARHRMTWSTYQVYRVDSEEAVITLGQVQAHWDPTRQSQPEIRARVVTRDGREHQFDPATLSDEGVEDPDPRIFNDVRMLRGPLPAIAVGSVVEVQVRVADLEPPFTAGRTQRVFLALGGAVERTRIVVSAPESLPLRHATRLLPDARITEELRDGRRVVTLEQGPLARDLEQFMLEAFGDQPFWPEFAFATGDSWDAVASAYAGMAEPYVRTVEVRTLLPARLPEERDARIGRLLEVLHERVRYTGVLFGMGKIVPNPPSVTLERRFGDCKDKAVVFASLLRAAGVPAELVLLNSGTGVDVDPGLPGISDFNHMIVHVPGERPLWIDPTVEYMKVGEMPVENRGRWALVIGSGGAALQRTPESRPGDLHQRVVRELRLADFGQADLRVSGRANGSEAERGRRAWSEKGAAAAKRRDDLLKALYAAETVVGFTHADDPASGELTYEFEARGVANGYTDFNEAVVRQSLAQLFNRLPAGLRLGDEARARMEDRDGDAKPAPRTSDWVFEPFVTEWQLRIVLPRGFRARSLPGDRDLALGPARFTQAFEVDAAGQVICTIRLDSGSGRYTIEQGEAFRRSFLEHEAELALELRFDHEAAALMNAGDEPGALRRHRELIAAEPATAVHRMRAANLLLEYGLVDEAREMARKATEIEPKNARAFSLLGIVLERNEIGERFGRGFDRDGAMRAHREAIRLDPEYTWYHANLAAVAEHAPDGTRYGAGSDLDLAIAGYRKYLERNPDWTEGKGSIIQCLWEAGRYDEIAREAADLPDSSRAQPLRLAARVMSAGVATALREDASRGDAAARRRRIEQAAAMLWKSRHYEEGRELMAALGSEGRGTGDGMTAVLMQLMQRTVRAEQLPEPPKTAAGAAESVMRLVFARDAGAGSMDAWFSRRARWNGGTAWLAERFGAVGSMSRQNLTRALGDLHEFVRDIFLCNLEFQESEAPGDARRIAVLMHGMAVATLFMVPEDGGWRVLTLAPLWYPVGREVLARLDAGDAASARAWLELAREETEKDESFEESTWLQQFNKALPRDAEEPGERGLRFGAHLLLAGPAKVGASVEDARRAGTLAATDAQKTAWHWMTFVTAHEAHDYELMVTSARDMYAADPAAADGYWLLTNGLASAGRWQEAERAGREWLAKHPNDERALQSVVDALNALGRAPEALGLLTPRVQRGRANPGQLNTYAWQALVAGMVDDGVVKASENSFNLQSRRDYASGHTLACVYAVAGRVTDARDLTQNLMDGNSQIDPYSGEIWLIRGLIFEHLGETAAAVRAFGKVEAPKVADPNSVFAIASARLAKLRGG